MSLAFFQLVFGWSISLGYNSDDIVSRY